MKGYWWILIGAVFMCIFSKQIDWALEKLVKNSKKRAILYCITGVVCLAAMGIFVYFAWSETVGNMALLIAFIPVSLFVIGVTAGILCGRARQRKKRMENHE